MPFLSTVPASPGRSQHAPSKRALKRVSEFDRSLRPRLMVLAERDRCFADLALTFPALLVALAIPRRGVDVARARALAEAGRPLKEIAAAAHVPMWLRAVPPLAFTGPIPELPDGLSARLEMPNFVPREASKLAMWLTAVAEAYAIGNEAIAIWIAREFRNSRYSRDYVRRISLWAWVSAEGQGTVAERLIHRPWTPSMSWEHAAQSAHAFSETVHLHILLDPGRDRDPWIGPSRMLGYEFVPVMSAAELAEEAAAMHHCVRSCGPDIASNVSRVFSIRADGKRVATVEISRWGSDPFPWIAQLQGPANTAVEERVWVATRRWVVAFGRPIASCGSVVPGSTLDRTVWQELWKPYWTAKNRIPRWLPLVPPINWCGI